MKKYLISQDFLCWFSRNKIPIRQFRQCIDNFRLYYNQHIPLNQYGLISPANLQARLQPKLRSFCVRRKFVWRYYISKMMNQNAVFREELKKILTNINKKHVVLRKQAIKTCEVFENEHLPVFPYEVCFGLFKHIEEANSLSSCLLFLPFLKNIIELGFANEKMSVQIISLLAHIKSLPKFRGLEQQTKIQQILMVLVSKNSISLEKIASTHAILNILMALGNQHSKILWNKSLLIAVQVSLLHLNELTDEPTKKQLFRAYLSDIIRLARGEAVKWLVQPCEQFIFMALLSELLEEKSFREAKDVFREELVLMLPALRKLIIKLYEGTIYQIPNSPSKHWEFPVQSKLVTCLRVACKVSRLYEHGFELLEELVKIFSEKGGPKALGYDCICYLFGSAQWMHSMLQSSSGDLFNFLLTTIFNTVKMLQGQLKEGDLSNKNGQEHYKLFTNNSLEIHFGELSHVGQIKAIVRSIDEIVFTYFSIYSEIYKISLDQKLEGKPPLEKTYKFIHKTVFEIVKAIISKEVAQETLQSLLKISERIINLAGVFADSSTAAIFIKLLCRYCMPNNQKGIGHRHVQINKMILNTANCLGNLFSTACWVTLWKAFQNYALYYNRYLLGQQHLQAQREHDVQILYASMESIFTQSPAYDDNYLQTVLQSLVEVTYECLENKYAEETKKIFAFERIEQVFKLNLHRVSRIWPPLINSLLILTTSRVQQYRLSSLALLNILVPSALHYLHTHQLALEKPFTSEIYQSLLLEPWKQLSDSPFLEVKAEVSAAVTKIVIDYGHIINKGWSTLLEIVKKLNDLTALQAIVETYLDKIQGQIEEMVDAIDKVQRSLSQPNQKYLCLTLIWTIGDHAFRKNMRPLLRKIYELLLQPEEMFVLGTEARHSSFYILAELLIHNCSQRQVQFWRWVFGLIDTFTNYVILRCLDLKQKIIVDQVLKNMLTNLLKIYRKFFLMLEGNKDFIKQRMGKFFNLASKLLQFRQSEVYQWTLKQIREMLAAGGEVTLQSQQLWGFLQKLTEVYYVENDNKILKVLITYLPIDIYEVLSHCLQKLPERLSLIYKLLEKVFLIRLQAEEKDIKIAQMRIFFQQKAFIELYRKLHGAVLQIQEKQILLDYQQLLTKTLHKLLLYEDESFLARMLPFLSSLTEKHSEKLEYQQLLDLLGAILALRLSEMWRLKHSKSKDPPIWLVATHESVRLGHTLAEHAGVELCSRGYAKLLALQMAQLGNKAPRLPEEAGGNDFLTNFYDSECTILYFVVENYLLGEKGTNLVTPEMQKKIIEVIDQSVHHFKEGDPSARAKNAYDILFKAAAKRNQINQEISKKQAILSHVLLTRIVNIIKAYTTLLSEGRGEGSDVEAEIKFVLKKVSQLHSGPGTFEGERQWMLEHIGATPRQGSSVWLSSRALIIVLTPLLLGLLRSSCQDIRQLVGECLQLSHSSLLLELQI